MANTTDPNFECSDRTACAATRHVGTPAFIDRYPGLFRMISLTALKIARDADDAKDISQDVWVKALLRTSTLTNEESFPAWIHRIAVNTALAYIRRNKRRHSRDMIHLCVFDDDILLQIDLERALATLPNGMRRVVGYRLAGETLRQAAQELGISEGTAKSQFHKAKAKLVVALSGMRSNTRSTASGRAIRASEGA